MPAVPNVTVPGLNVAHIARNIITFVPMIVYKSLSRTTSNRGLDQNIFAAPVLLVASAQPLTTELAEKLGMEWKPEGFTFIAEADLKSVSRNLTGDLIFFRERYYNITRTSPWHSLDGWTRAVAFRVPEPAGLNKDTSDIWGFGPNNANFNQGNFEDEV